MKEKLKKISVGILTFIVCLVQIQTPIMAKDLVSATDSDNIALNKSVAYSGVEGGKVGSDWKYPQFKGESAVDGNEETRWSADKLDLQWITVDLGKVYKIQDITISFHGIAPEYDIQIAKEADAFTTIASRVEPVNGSAALREFDASGAEARYVKYVQKKMFTAASNGQKYGSSIREVIIREKKDIEISEDSIKVGTFNIAANKNPDLVAQRALTEKYKLELVGLQEVDVNTGRNPFDMLAAFAGTLYPSYYFSKAIDFSGGQYGIGTVSRYPLSDTSNTFVNTTGASEKRVFQRSVIKKNGKNIAFYNTHLSYETPEIRVKQFKQLKDAIASDPMEYKIVVGDFNADQYHSEFYTFLEDMDMANGYQGVWYDTYNEVDATMKVNSVDNILFTRNLEVASINLEKTTLSDHHLLVAELKFLDENKVSTEWLRTSIEEAESLNTSAYLEEQVAELQQVIEVAKALQSVPTTQAEVNAQTKTLNEKVAGMEVFNLAYKKDVTYSGVEGEKVGGVWKYPQFVGESAVDGKQDTRWSASKENDLQWLTIDLGEAKDISEVILNIHASAPKYEVLLSTDGENFTSVYNQTDGKHGETYIQQVSFPSQKARYVKYQQNERWLHSNKQLYSTSIIEMEVYKEFRIKEISVNNQIHVMSKGQNFQLETKILPKRAKHKLVTYTSDNPSVAVVSEKGLITAISKGKVNITIADKEYPEVKKTFEVEVVVGDIKVSAYTFDQEELTMDSRSKRFVDYQAYPLNAVDLDREVEWKSADESIAKVNKEGLVEAQKPGIATITVQAKGDAAIKGELKVVITDVAFDAEFGVMQDRWIARVYGDDSLDANDADIKNYIKKVETDAKKAWDTMDKSATRSDLWPIGITSPTSVQRGAHYTTRFTNLKVMAQAFGTKGSSLYQNRELLEDIIDAVNYMVEKQGYNGTSFNGNWWDAPIGSAHALIDTLMMVSDYVDYDKIEPAIKSMEGYAKRPSHQWPSYTASGANRTDIGLTVLGSGILARSEARLALINADVPDVMKLVTSGDGLYADGSVVQHTFFAYSGSYGNELLKGVGRLQQVLGGTKWEIKDSRINNVYETVRNGYIPLMHKGQMMSMVNGRSISRPEGTNPFTTEFAAGEETIANLVSIAAAAPAEYSSEIVSAVKYWSESSKGSFDFYGKARDLGTIVDVKRVLSDSAITSDQYKGMKVYGSMDRVVQANDTHTFGLSMYSSRVANYESGNAENYKGWNTGSGALYIYNNDLRQYGDGYWPTVDSYRLPGTTVDTKTLANGANSSKKSAEAWVGGVTNGVDGSAGMQLNTSNIDMDLKAKKSWFFINGKVVALGSDISGTTAASIETVVENRLLSDDGKIAINDVTWNGTNEDKNLNANDYVHFEGKGSGNDIGYYFFGDQKVSMQKEKRTGKYTDINGTFITEENKEYSLDYFKLLIHHGKNVSNDTYEYMIVPGATNVEMKALAAKNTISVIKNDKDVQAVKDTKNNILAMNVWNASGAELEGIKVNKAASIYVKEHDGNVTISISDPTQKTAAIELVTDINYLNVVSMSDKVTQNGSKFIINTNKTYGGAHTITLKLAIDKTQLAQKIVELNLLEESDYTPNSWQAFTTTLQAAQEVLDNATATVEEITAAMDSLRDAEVSLVKRADKAELNTLIAEVDDMSSEDYTATSWNVLQQRLDEARNIVANENASAQDVSTALTNLRQAITDLSEKADTSFLAEKIQLAQSLNQANYTPTSWSELQRVLALAITAMDAEGQQDVDAALASLQTALNQLETMSPELEQRTLVSADGRVTISGRLPVDAELAIVYPKVEDIVSRILDKNFKRDFKVEEVFDIQILQAGSAIQPLDYVDVVLKTKAAYQSKTLGVAYIAEDGSLETFTTKTNGDSIAFSTNHLSDYAIASKIENNKETNSAKNKGTSTGDATNISMLLLLAGSAGLSVLYILKKSKKKS